VPGTVAGLQLNWELQLPEAGVFQLPLAAKADGALAASKLKHTTNLAMVVWRLIYGF
jgi:hypothetical protein